jgi:predicted kinase
MMDIQDRGYPELAYRFLNAYLQRCGDYAGVAVLRYYLVYRALVRAKVAILRLAQVGADAAEKTEIWKEYESYLALARQYTGAAHAAVIITHGVSGTGKSWCAAQLAERCGAIQIRSDIERKRLYGYRADAETQSGVESGIYSQEASHRTYRRLEQLAREVIDGGYPVIADAAFLKQAERECFRRLAKDLGVPFVLLHFHADKDLLHARLRQRQAAGGDPSEAGIEVLESQMQGQELLSPGELSGALSVDTSRVSIDQLARQLTEKISA